MPETAERLDEPSVFERQPGQVDYECRTAIRDLIDLYGPDRAKEMIAFFMDDEERRRH